MQNIFFISEINNPRGTLIEANLRKNKKVIKTG